MQALCGRVVRPCSFVSSHTAAPPRRQLVIQNAHKKGSSASKNGRDSNSKSRGVKVYGGQAVTAGGIIVRQVGNTFHAGNNVGTGKDYTLYSLQEGIVVFEKIKSRKCVSVYEDGHEKTAGLRLAKMQHSGPKPDKKAFRARKSAPSTAPLAI